MANHNTVGYPQAVVYAGLARGRLDWVFTACVWSAALSVTAVFGWVGWRCDLARRWTIVVVVPY